jgi:hypothetical protein
MSSNNPANPFGEPSGSHFNPYSSPQHGGSANFPPQNLVQMVKGKVIPPAIALIVVASIGLALSLFNVVFAVVAKPPVIDPNAPQWVQEFQKNQTGPVAMVVQGLMAIVNVVIIAGGVQMARIKTRPLGFVAAILAMVNFGSCCCILGIPAGIWSIVILCQSDVAKAFEQNSG